MRATVIACAALSAVALSGCDPMATSGGPGPRMSAASPTARPCFDVRQVENFRAGRIGTLYLKVRRHDVYEVNTGGGCPDLDFANRMAIIPDFAGATGGRICVGDSARIIVPDSSSPPGPCRVMVERLLTPDEVAALDPRYRP